MECIQEGKQVTDYQLCFIFKCGISGVLDVARKTLQETFQDILDYAKALSQLHSVTLTVKYTNAHRFLFSCKNADDLPASYFSKVGNFGYSTIDLQKLNERVNESMEEILLFSTK